MRPSPASVGHSRPASSTRKRTVRVCPERVRSAVWSPDFSEVAFVSDRDGNLEIYLMAADGSNPRNLTNDPGADFGPTFRPATAS